MLFNLINLPYWILLGMGVLLFLVVIVSGGADSDSDLNTDLDVDLEVDADSDFSMGQLMGWLGVGKAPLILLLAMDLSLIGLFGWMLNVLLNDWLDVLPDSLLSGMVFAVALVAAVLVGSLLSRPIGKVFESFGEDVSRDRLIGCLGTVSSAVIPAVQEKRIGQVDVLDLSRNRVTIHAALPDWASIQPKLGDRVLVIDRHLDTYLVVLKDSSDQDKWLENKPQVEK